MAEVPPLDYAEGDECVHCLALLQPFSCHTTFDDLPAEMEMQREYISRLNGGAPTCGYLYFFKIKRVFHLRYPWPMPIAVGGTMNFFSSLPDWYVTSCLQDVASNATAGNRDGYLVDLLPSWMREDMCNLCLRVAKPYAALAAFKFLHHLAVAGLGHLARLL